MMKTLHFGLFCLMILGLISFAHAIEDEDACVPPGGYVASEQICCQPLPGDFVALNGTCQSKPSECIQKNMSVLAPKVCCVGLSEVGGVCQDPSLVDPTITSCETNPNLCTDGTGCFSQREEDIFSATPRSSTEYDFINSVLTQRENNEVDEHRPEGDYCIRNSQCQTYKCLGNACVPTKICRLADEGEVAGGAKCEDGLIVDSTNGKCKLLPAIIQGPISGNTEPDPTNKCQFRFPDDMKAKAEYALKQTRAMEWLLQSMTAGNDCLNTTNYLRSIGDKFVARRKELLKTFNQGMSKVDSDMGILLASKDKLKDPNEIVSLYSETLTRKELAGRLTSGVDMLRAMRERNIVFKVYESEMNKLTHLTAKRILALLDLFGKDGEPGQLGWADHQKREWIVPRETSISADGLTPVFALDRYHGKDESCRGGGLFDLGRRRVYKRWHHQFFFTSRIFNDANIKAELAQIVYPEKVTLVRTNNLKDTSLVRNTAAAEQELARAMGLPGGKNMFAIDHANSFRDYASVRANLKYFFSTLKSDLTLSSFNHEPDLLPLEAKNCTDGSTAPGCEKFPEFLDGVAKIAYAQSYAYSSHTRSNYKFFFNGDVWRKKLMRTWVNQLDYLTGYYATMTEHRLKQNKCLEDAQGNADEFLDNTGMTEGAKNYYVGTDYQGVPSGQVVNTRTGPLFESKNVFEFESNLLKSLSWNNNTDKVPKDSSGKAALLEVNTASLASRMKSSKGLSRVKGSPLPTFLAPSAALNSTTASPMGSGSGSSASSGVGSSETSALGGGKASLGDEIFPTADEKGESKATGLVKGSEGAGYAPLNGSPSGFGNESLGGTSILGNAGVDLKGKDQTGMSDEEKDVVMANYQRTKSKYEPKEEDTLFTIINKTYVRNLDKILRKKPAAQAE